MQTKVRERHKGPAPIYPWAKWWGSKRPFQLVQGVDYTCKSYSLCDRLYKEAKVEGVRVSIKTHRTGKGKDVLTVTVHRGKKGK